MTLTNDLKTFVIKSPGNVVTTERGQKEGKRGGATFTRERKEEEK